MASETRKEGVGEEPDEEGPQTVSGIFLSGDQGSFLLWDSEL